LFGCYLGLGTIGSVPGSTIAEESVVVPSVVVETVESLVEDTSL
jgi:hypothetical protein